MLYLVYVYAYAKINDQSVKQGYSLSLELW